ncbi:MAG: NUDIX domain-containing protein [Planctomycetaceae bacterium]|nr:NUDIX domain-containing protein [Planctomycetaceae bacterium]
MEEIFDVCDLHDRVIGQAPRSVVHEKNLLHRAVHIWLWRSDGRLVVHLRSRQKDQFPQCYTSSASGHVDHGESYDQAAKRELWEELKLGGEISFVCQLPAGPETAYEHTALYFLQSDDEPHPDPQEIERLEERWFVEILQRVETSPERFTPPFCELVQFLARTPEFLPPHVSRFLPKGQ